MSFLFLLPQIYFVVNLTEQSSSDVHLLRCNEGLLICTILTFSEDYYSIKIFKICDFSFFSFFLDQSAVWFT